MSISMERTGKRLAGYDLMMRETALSSYETPEDFMCGGCTHHRSEWKYRYCELTECTFIKGQQTFREQYLEGGVK